MNDTPLYDRQPGESSKAFAKYLIYRNIKPDRRSLLAAYGLYQEQAEKGRRGAYKSVPGSWREIADQWNWKARAQAYDAKLQAEQEAREQALREFESAEIERILTTGLASTHERVQALAEFATEVRKSFNDPDTGKVNPKWLTPDKIREWRGLLDDIAKEVGGRVKKDKLEHSGSVEFKTEWGGGKLEDSEE